MWVSQKIFTSKRMQDKTPPWECYVNFFFPLTNTSFVVNSISGIFFIVISGSGKKQPFAILAQDSEIFFLNIISSTIQ